MNIIRPLSAKAAFYLLLFQSNVPGQGLLDSISQFITGPFGKAITLIAIVLCGVSYSRIAAANLHPNPPQATDAQFKAAFGDHPQIQYP